MRRWDDENLLDASVRNYRVNFDFHKPLRFDESRHFHHGVDRLNVLKVFSSHLGYLLPVSILVRSIQVRTTSFMDDPASSRAALIVSRR
jgi:hypothetical protein